MGKNKKIYLITLVIFLMGISGYALKNRLSTAGPVEPDVAILSETDISIPPSASEITHDDERADTPSTDGSVDDTEEIVEDKDRPTGVSTTTAASGLSNTRHGWGLKRNSEHRQPEMPSSITAMLNRHGAYWVGNPNEKAVYLTFDEGYENGYTAGILDTLKANNVKAAFFVTGHYLKSQPDLVKRMVDEGHIVANHTDTHPSLPDVSDEQIKKELQAVEQKYEELTGRKEMKYLRPPKGEYSERTLAVTREYGYNNIFWSMALVDWVPMPGGPEEAYRSVMDNLHNGALILLHAVSKDNAEAMDRILKDIKAQGYTFKTLDDLVGS